ncbi:MAG: hypothetical protein O7D34_04055, partial [Ignavibacteria bacterium]|nr:hypothetical protein [Ignavibacteria bacterium]
MKLQIGLVTQSLVWEQICLQEGVPFGIVDLATKDVQEECSLLVVNRPLTELERENVEQYLRNGGGVLGYALYLFQVAGTNSLRERLDYIVSDHDEVFSDLHLIDLGIYGSVPREANCMRTCANTFAVFAGPLGGGFAVILPFDAVEVLKDYRAASKNFYFTRDRLPSERVSLVSKGEVRHLLHRSFEYLHHVRGLPYAHL